MIKFFLFPVFFSVCLVFADSDDTCRPAALYQRPGNWKDRVRLRTLENLNQFLNWSFGDKYKKYELADNTEELQFEVSVPELKSFVENYGYFSLHPIVGNVTTEKEDIVVVSCLLKALFEEGGPADFMQMAIDEVMTKAFAYRDPKIGQRFSIPVVVGDQLFLERFTVDRIFNLWRGMPAFGLVPETEKTSSILIFRGTDFSLDSQRGWASLMSDLDIVGPGLTAFQRSQKEIRKWLQKVQAQGKAARVMGFSLGGALAAYAYIYENQWLADQGSVSFCAPGIRPKVIAEWDLLSSEKQNGFINYVNQGDIVSKVGLLFGNVYVLMAEKNFKPLTAHTMLMSSMPKFTIAQVDVQKENASR